MGIGQAISRVKESVRKAGLDSVVAGLGEQLRSTAIPASLRPAATRLADLLHVKEGAPVVSLTQAVGLDPIGAHPTGESNTHGSASHDELASVGGVCPVSGMNAGLAGLLDPGQFDAASFEAPALEVVHTPDELEKEAVQPAKKPKAARKKTPVRAAVATEELAAAKRVPHNADSGALKRTAKTTGKAASSRPAPKHASAQAPAPTRVKAQAKATAATHDKAHDKTAAKSRKSSAKSQSATAANKKSQATAEKDSEQVAARPATSKTPARSKASTSKPAAKRPTAKAATKKN